MLELEKVFISFSVISMCCSGSVLATVIMFPEMKKRLFMKIIVYISLSDLLSSFVSSFGYPVDRTVLCQSQAFFAVYFFVSSWLWTTMLAHQLYSVATKAKFGLRHRYMHIVCWVVPLLCSLLPLSTNRYGRDDDDGDPSSWCYLAGNNTSSATWNIITFIVPLFMCILIMFFYSCRTLWLYYSLGLNRPDLYATVHALMLYPLGMIVSWGPNLVFILYVIANPGPHSPHYILTADVVSILCTQNGTITALIFFYKSKEARLRWWWKIAHWLSIADEDNINGHSTSSKLNESSIVEDKIPFDFEEKGYYNLDDDNNEHQQHSNSSNKTSNSISLQRNGVSFNSMLQLMFGEGDKLGDAVVGIPDHGHGQGNGSTDPLLPYDNRQHSMVSAVSDKSIGWDLYPES